MSGLVVHVTGVGVIGPGLAGWAASIDVLAGKAKVPEGATVVPPPECLPPAERRRAGLAVKIALAAAHDACASAIDAASLATVFTSSNGDGVNCHALCEMLAQAEPTISPTRFTNSVHNAPAGYWHIALKNPAASTSLCMHDASFAAGLLEAALQVRATGRAVLLVASDAPHPDPMSRVRPTQDSFGAGFVLSPDATGSLARLGLEFVPAIDGETACADATLETLRRGVSAARALPLLQALAGCRDETIVFDHPGGLQLRAQLKAR